jgi:hypothetical protein
MEISKCKLVEVSQVKFIKIVDGLWARWESSLVVLCQIALLTIIILNENRDFP